MDMMLSSNYPSEVAPQNANSGPHHHSFDPTSPKSSRRDSKVFLSPQYTGKSSSSIISRREYFDALELPGAEMIERIAEVQKRKEEEAMQRRIEQRAQDDSLNGAEREQAAGLIQRNYRGHRERRMLAGMSLDPSTRWAEAVKEARYRHLTEPRPRGYSSLGINTKGSGAGIEEQPQSTARLNWRKVGFITRRAGADEDSGEDHDDDDDEDVNPDEKEAQKKHRHEQKSERQKSAKLMDLQYFLEMVDLKHRYGSNLRTYHEEWKKSDTNENFFYWLDYGEGKTLECVACPRERLEHEQVRYLSKEERMNYLVKIDKEGKLCWAKNGARIDTTQQFKDSIHGIVPHTDSTPAYGPAAAAELARTHSRIGSSSSSRSSSSSNSEDDTSAQAEKYATPQSEKSKGVKKVKHVSAATIFNKLLRGSVKKNTWIFVADTSFRLYVGIKQSGAFQHSSFLHGSRISAAGLIKIKNGRLSKLSPLSGHYRPPVSNFRAFVHSLKDTGVDMSHVSISRSYAVLVGLEAYVKTRRRGKSMIQKLVHRRDRILSPDELAEREEAARDKSESAAKEKKFLESKQEAEEEAKLENGVRVKLMDKLQMSPQTPKHEAIPNAQYPGSGPTNAISPDGRRNE